MDWDKVVEEAKRLQEASAKGGLGASIDTCLLVAATMAGAKGQGCGKKCGKDSGQPPTQ